MLLARRSAYLQPFFRYGDFLGPEDRWRGRRRARYPGGPCGAMCLLVCGPEVVVTSKGSEPPHVCLQGFALAMH